jgi:hypothetical protein
MARKKKNGFAKNLGEPVFLCETAKMEILNRLLYFI